MIGFGAIGEEIAAMISVSFQFMDVSMNDAAKLDEEVFHGYLQGLADAGWRGEERQVRLGYTIASAYLLGVAGIGIWMDYVLDESVHEVMGNTFVSSFDKILERFAELQFFLLDLGDEAGELLKKMGNQ